VKADHHIRWAVLIQMVAGWSVDRIRNECPKNPPTTGAVNDGINEVLEVVGFTRRPKNPAGRPPVKANAVS